MDPSAPPPSVAFPPQSATPPLPPSYQTQRPEQHGWNDPPPASFSAGASSRRKAPRLAGSYLNPQHAPPPHPLPQYPAGHPHHAGHEDAPVGNGAPAFEAAYAPAGPAYGVPPPALAPTPPPQHAVAYRPATATPEPPRTVTPTASASPAPAPTPPPQRVSSVSPAPAAAAAQPSQTPVLQADSEAILASIRQAMDDARANVSDTPSKRILDDSERRLKSLTDKLGRNALAPQVLQLLIELSDGLTKKDKAAASATATSLMSAALAYSKEGDDSGWSVGLKRLVVDVWAKAVPTE